MENPVTNAGARSTDEGPKRYVRARDGNGNEVRHINFNNKEMCPRVGIIRLEPLKTWGINEQRHKANISFRIVRDRADDIIVGIPLRVDPKTKEWEYERINLKGPETFDLSIEKEAKRWACIRLSPYLEGSPNLQDKPLYKVIDTQKQAQNFMESLVTKRKAEDISIGLSGEQLTDMARAIGISPEQNTEVTLKAAVIGYAQKNGEKFMDIWNSPTRKYHFIFKKAYLFGLIEQNHLEGYLYRGVPMGASDAIAIEWLSQNPNVANAIDVQCQAKEKPEVKKLHQVGSSKIGDEKDAKLAEYEAKLASMDAMIKKLSAQALEEDTGHKEGEFFVDEELQELRDKMKKYGLGGFNMIKDKEKAKAKIAEYEKNANN